MVHLLVGFVEHSCDRCNICCRGKSMLTQTEMFVVFVLDEIISQGTFLKGKRQEVFLSLMKIWKTYL